MTEEETATTVDTISQEAPKPAPCVPVDVSNVGSTNTLKLDIIFGDAYHALKDSVKAFIFNLSMAGMSAEQSAIHAFEHAKLLVEHYHQTPINSAQQSVLTAHLLKDATDPQVPIQPPVADNTTEQGTPEQLHAPNAEPSQE